MAKEQELSQNQEQLKCHEEKLVLAQENIANILQTILSSGNSEFMDLIESTVSFKEQ